MNNFFKNKEKKNNKEKNENEENDNIYLIKFYFKKLIYLIIFIFTICLKEIIGQNSLNIYIKFFNVCKGFKKLYFSPKKNNRYPFLSICIPVFNMEEYIERAILSVINQSFQDFEIIVINDLSKDNSENIIKRLQMEDNRIRLINHKKNLCTFFSRIDGVFNSKGNYIIFLDPDDMFINPNLFQKLFDYNLKYNLDIIEFSVYYYNEENKNFYFPSNHNLNHYHNFKKDIIYQPELSNILFYIPKINKSSDIICRIIWNKIIKREILLKSINYINRYYKKECFNYAEDTLMNVILFQLSFNYSCIKLPGYMYNIRKDSISHGNGEIKQEIMISRSCLFYLTLFYRYIIYFKKDNNYLLKEIKIFSNHLLKIKLLFIFMILNMQNLLYLYSLFKI